MEQGNSGRRRGNFSLEVPAPPPPEPKPQPDWKPLLILLPALILLGL